MPQYGSTILLLFILASCFYKKHIKDWWWFKFGLVATAIGILAPELGGVALQHQTLNVLFRETFNRFQVGDVRLAYFLGLTGKIALVSALIAFVIACIKGARQDVEHIRCLKCGYILKGLSEPRCPECGQQI